MKSKSYKKNANSNSEPIVTEYGTRKISNCNFSKLVALPKNALLNCGGEDLKQVDVKLVQDKGERYIKLTPLSEKEKGEEKN